MVDRWTRVDGVWRLGKSTTTAAASWTANGIPPAGELLIGQCAYAGGTASIQSVEDDLGSTVALHRIYYSAGAGTTGMAALIASDHANNRIPWISWKLPVGIDWVAAAAGDADSWMTNIASIVDGVTTGPVWIAIHHEPEGDGAEADYRAMQAHLLPFFSGAHVLKTIIIAGYQAANGGAWAWEDGYPGDGIFDVMAFDPYNLAHSNLGSSWYEFGADKPGYFPALQTWCATHPTGATDGGPIRWAVAETGWTDDAFDLGTDDLGGTPLGPAEDWFMRVRANAITYGGIALTYFGVDYEPPTNQWNWTHDPVGPLKEAKIAAVQALSAVYPFA